MGKLATCDGDSVCQRNAGRVADVARFVVDDFIAWIDERSQGDVERFAHSHRDQDLPPRIVPDAESRIEADRDGVAQSRQAQIGRVGGPASFEGVDGGFADVPRRDEIRLSHTEGNHVWEPLDDVKELPDARARDCPDMVGYKLA